MKKVLSIALVLVLALTVVAFTACETEKTYTGSVSYVNYGVTYGAKVDVTVKGETITAVKLYTDEETGWRRTSPDNAAYGWERYQATEDAYEDYLASFVGKSVKDIMALEASATAAGQTVGENVDKIAGSTQSSARIICAIQNALAKSGEFKGTGSVSYENYGVTYGAKVDVTEKNGVITAVKLYTDEETGWRRTSPDNATYGWERYQATEDAYEDYLASFVGMDIDAVLALEASATSAGQTVGENVAKIAGSTQSSARIICAIQNAIRNLGK